MTVGKKLAAARKAAGYTQEKLARRMRNNVGMLHW